MNVAKITPELASELLYQEFRPNQRFNPVQDGNGNWIVTLVEAQYLDINSFEAIIYTPPHNSHETIHKRQPSSN